MDDADESVAERAMLTAAAVMALCSHTEPLGVGVRARTYPAAALARRCVKSDGTPLFAGQFDLRVPR